MVETQQQETGKAAAPPYTAFQSIKTLAKQMKENGIPSRIDRSVLTNFSGAVGGQVLTALKFLGLTNDDGEPTPDLKALVEAHDTDAWPAKLAAIIQKAYAPVFKLNLETASPNQFGEHFRKLYPAADDSSRKSVTFFLNAVRDAQIKISPYIMKNKKPRSAPAKRRAAKANGGPPGDETTEAERAVAAAAAALAAKKPSETMLDLLDPKDMKQPEQDAIWLLIKYFKAKGR